MYDIDADSKATFSYRNNQWGYGWRSPQSFLYDSHGNNLFSGNREHQRCSGLPYKPRISSIPTTTALLWRIYSMENMRQNYSAMPFLKSPEASSILRTTGMPASRTTATQSWGPGQYHLDFFPDGRHGRAALLSCLREASDHLWRLHFATMKPTSRQQISATGQIRGRRPAPYSDSKGKDNIYSFYTQAEIALLRNLTLYAGVRGDYWTTYDGFAEIARCGRLPSVYGIEERLFRRSQRVACLQTLGRHYVQDLDRNGFSTSHRI